MSDYIQNISSTMSALSFSSDHNFPEKESIDKLLTNRDLLEAVFNTSTLGLHVLESIRNEQGVIVDFYIRLTNEMSDKIAGRGVSGMQMLEGWPHTKEIGLFDKFVETVETGSAVDYEQHYQADGVSAWFRWLASKFNDGLYVTIEDITARKTAEENIRQTARKLQSTIDGVPSIIALIEPVFDQYNEPIDFIISAANHATLAFANATHEALIGEKIALLFPEALREDLLNTYISVFKTTEPVSHEFLFPGIDKWFSISVARQSEGKGIVVAAVDITEQKKSEEEERQIEVLTTLDKIKTEFFSNVSHELRTPLALILGPLEETLSNAGLTRTQFQRLDMARRNTLRLQKLVNSLLDFARIEAGRFDIIFQPTDLAEFTALLSGNFRSMIEKAGIKLVLNIESTEAVYVNRNAWEKIVFNLLSNALKFTSKGKIEVVIKNNKHHVQLQVCDTGIGISDENLARIFERFVRIENVSSRSYEGSGIGLALVKELVLLQGGTIKVKSKLQRGSEFIVTIPKGKKHLPQNRIHELKDSRYSSFLYETFREEIKSWDQRMREEAPVTGEKPTILLVDDNSDLREYIRSILQYDYNVVSAANGAKAIASLKHDKAPDLILADVMMPEMNGFEFLKAIRTDHPELESVPFVFLSARASEEDKVRGLNQGADDYLIKPFAAKELLALVRTRIKRMIKSSAEVKDRSALDLNDVTNVLVRQKKFLYDALDALPQKLWIFDSAGKVNFLNRKWFDYAGVGNNEDVPLRYDTYYPSFHPDDASTLHQLWWQHVSRGENHSAECRLKDSQGIFRLHSDSTIRIAGEHQGEYVWIRIFTDIQEISAQHNPGV